VPPVTVNVALPFALRWFTLTPADEAIPPVWLKMPVPSVAMARSAVASVMFSTPPLRLYVLVSFGQWPSRMAAFSPELLVTVRVPPV